MSKKGPIDEELARALACHLESERAFDMRDLPRGHRDEAEGGAELEPEASTGPAEPRRLDERSLEIVAAQIADCRDCGLCESRTRTVPGQGAAQARLMFVGEAPGAEEDRSGEAFVGPAGQLLTKMIAAMGLSREDVFIANVLKCRPPGNRDPEPGEVQACFHYLLDQIELIRPEVICALGAHAANNLLERSEPIGRMRGRIFDFQGLKLVPTYHPSYLLRSPDQKRKAWEDLQVVMEILGLEPPTRGSGHA